jgi:hypothetical protein
VVQGLVDRPFVLIDELPQRNGKGAFHLVVRKQLLLAHVHPHIAGQE